MKISFSLILGLAILLCNFSGCDNKNETDPPCNQITLNKPFNARINDVWCLDQAKWKIRFGPAIEDSRCNVPGIDCFWAGRFVMAATIQNSEVVQDTFVAVQNWSDTLYSGQYSIILNKVFPETRPTMDQLDPSKYSFEVIVK